MIEWSAVVGYINNPNLTMHINDISHKPTGLSSLVVLQKIRWFYVITAGTGQSDTRTTFTPETPLPSGCWSPSSGWCPSSSPWLLSSAGRMKTGRRMWKMENAWLVFWQGTLSLIKTDFQMMTSHILLTVRKRSFVLTRRKYNLRHINIYI